MRAPLLTPGMRDPGGHGNVPAMRRLSILLLAAIVACGGPKAPPNQPTVAVAQPAAQLGPDDTPLPMWPSIKKGKLANGLTYYVLKHGKPQKRAFLWLAVNAGSVQEDDDQRGLAHFNEHMAFNG